MFNINDVVVYRNNSVNRIIDIQEENINNVVKRFYVLESVYVKSSITYVPIDNQELVSKIRRVLSEEEVYALLDQLPDINMNWISSDLKRKDKFKEVLNNGSREELFGVVRALYFHSMKLKDSGKKFHMNDSRVLKEAENVLYEEIAYVLGIDKENVVEYIRNYIENEKK